MYDFSLQYHGAVALRTRARADLGGVFVGIDFVLVYLFPFLCLSFLQYRGMRDVLQITGPGHNSTEYCVTEGK